MSAIFDAKHRGRCGNCDEQIDIGDSVTYDEDEVVHIGCVGQSLTAGLGVQEKVCDSCYLVHRGDCF